jgi:hypothetical protein
MTEPVNDPVETPATEGMKAPARAPAKSAPKKPTRSAAKPPAKAPARAAAKPAAPAAVATSAAAATPQTAPAEQTTMPVDSGAFATQAPSPGPSVPPPTAQPRSTRRRRARPRQARVVIRKLGPWSVLKISFLFYLCVMAAIVGAFVILYGLLGAIGALDSVTRLIRDLFADPTFVIDGNWLFTRGLAIGFGMVVLWTLINVFVAFLYNLLSDLVGGIEVTMSERK